MLGIYPWRRRYVPATLPFALSCLFAGLWTLGHGFELMAVTPARQLFWAQFLTAAKVTPLEFTIGGGDSARHTTAQATPLYDGRGRLYGCLLLLRDVTEQHRAAALLLAQQRALATLQERERLARELHDSAGQMLAYVSLQAQAICQNVRDGDSAAAEAQLTQLAAAAQGAHVDVRESILSLKAALLPRPGREAAGRVQPPSQDRLRGHLLLERQQLQRRAVAGHRPRRDARGGRD